MPGLIQKLALSAEVRDLILHLAEASAPDECCGMLLGRASLPGQPATVVSAAAAQNLEAGHSQRRFRIAPAAVAQASQVARAQGLELLGFFHSHPRGIAAPSEEDIAEASAWPGYYHIIAAPTDAQPLRAYRTGAQRWHEQQLV
jgi:proteasome lid subunit RPN8/RPN11